MKVRYVTEGSRYWRYIMVLKVLKVHQSPEGPSRSILIFRVWKDKDNCENSNEVVSTVQIQRDERYKLPQMWKNLISFNSKSEDFLLLFLSELGWPYFSFIKLSILKICERREKAARSRNCFNFVCNFNKAFSLSLSCSSFSLLNLQFPFYLFFKHRRYG